MVIGSPWEGRVRLVLGGAGVEGIGRGEVRGLGVLWGSTCLDLTTTWGGSRRSPLGLLHLQRTEMVVVLSAFRRGCTPGVAVYKPLTQSLLEAENRVEICLPVWLEQQVACISWSLTIDSGERSGMHEYSNLHEGANQKKTLFREEHECKSKF